jgi:CheY-like chemotaxis protein
MARILVVEDDAGQLEMRKQILEHAGYQVVGAQSAAEALERFSGCQLVLMDLRVPTEEDGMRLIQAASGSARIIVLSGAGSDVPLPVDEFLTKPFSSRRLLEIIAKWTSASK